MMQFLTTLLDRRKPESLAHKGLEWLWANRGGFQITESKDGDMPWEVKPLVELMFLLTVLKRHGFRYPLMDPLTTFAIETANNFDWHQMAAYDPSAATPLALVATFYNTTGRPLPFEDTYFRYLTRIRFFEGMDRLPYRQMDFAYSLGVTGIHDYEPYLASWFENTAFGRRQHLARYSIGDLYSLTHAVFYLTDIGLQPSARHLDKETDLRLRRELIQLSAMMVRGDNIDVLGELLLCCLMCGMELGGHDGLIFRQALRFLEGWHFSDGSLPPTRAVFEKAKNGSADFASLYHTTLVSVLLYSFLRKANLS